MSDSVVLGRLGRDLESSFGTWCVVVYIRCIRVSWERIRHLEIPGDIEDYLMNEPEREICQLVVWVSGFSGHKRIPWRQVLQNLGRLNIRSESDKRDIMWIRDIEIPEDILGEAIDNAIPKDITPEKLKKKFKINFGSSRNYLRLRWIKENGLDFVT